MAADLVKHVSLFDGKGVLHTFGPGDDVPAWARKRITNPAVWDGEIEDDDEHDGDGPPPQSGKGSSEKAWATYAEAQGVNIEGLDTRAEIIAACEAAGVPVE